MTFTFDGTSCTIRSARVHGDTKDGFDVTVIEGGYTVLLETVDGADLYTNALANVRVVADMSAWTRDRIAYVFSLAAGRIAKQSLAA